MNNDTTHPVNKTKNKTNEVKIKLNVNECQRCVIIYIN